VPGTALTYPLESVGSGGSATPADDGRQAGLLEPLPTCTADVDVAPELLTDGTLLAVRASNQRFTAGCRNSGDAEAPCALTSTRQRG